MEPRALQLTSIEKNSLYQNISSTAWLLLIVEPNDAEPKAGASASHHSEASLTRPWARPEHIVPPLNPR